MADEMVLDGKTFISSRRAAEMVEYTRDYVGQLCRSGVLGCQRVGSAWFVDKESLIKHASLGGKWSAERVKEKREKAYPSSRGIQTIVSFDGKEYISSGRASKITGYSQDYITQLARSGKVASREVGNRWYVANDELLEHKKRTDAQLGAVQADSVGLVRPEEQKQLAKEKIEDVKTHFSYHVDERPLMPTIDKPYSVADTSLADIPVNPGISLGEPENSHISDPETLPEVEESKVIEDISDNTNDESFSIPINKIQPRTFTRSSSPRVPVRLPATAPMQKMRPLPGQKENLGNPRNGNKGKKSNALPIMIVVTTMVLIGLIISFLFSFPMGDASGVPGGVSTPQTSSVLEPIFKLLESPTEYRQP